jgi:hypothetical protein
MVLGLVMGAVALDGYRRTVRNDNKNKQLETIRAEAKAILAAAEEAARVEYQKKKKKKKIAETHETAKNCAVIGRYKEAPAEHLSSVEAYDKNTTEYRKNEMERAKQKLDKSYDEVKELKELSIFEYFNSLYNNYNEYLDTLTSYKIVCVFNIII